MQEAATTPEGRVRRSRGPGWLAVGVAVGLILAPAAAVAAGVSVSQLVGPNGVHATVSRAGQLATAPADPGLYRAFEDMSVLGSAPVCSKAFTVPHGYSFVLTGLELDTYSDPTPGIANYVQIDVDEGHTPCFATLVNINPGGIGLTTVPIQPGFVIPQGHSISVLPYGGVEAELYGQGYLVPYAAAPKETPSSSARVSLGDARTQPRP